MGVEPTYPVKPGWLVLTGVKESARANQAVIANSRDSASSGAMQPSKEGRPGVAQAGYRCPAQGALRHYVPALWRPPAGPAGLRRTSVRYCSSLWRVRDRGVSPACGPFPRGAYLPVHDACPHQAPLPDSYHLEVPREGSRTGGPGDLPRVISRYGGRRGPALPAYYPAGLPWRVRSRHPARRPLPPQGAKKLDYDFFIVPSFDNSSVAARKRGKARGIEGLLTPRAWI